MDPFAARDKLRLAAETYNDDDEPEDKKLAILQKAAGRFAAACLREFVGHPDGSLWPHKTWEDAIASLERWSSD